MPLLSLRADPPGIPHLDEGGEVLQPLSGDPSVLRKLDDLGKLFPIEEKSPGMAVFEIEVIWLPFWIKGELK